jgi:hypothetical protein
LFATPGGFHNRRIIMDTIWLLPVLAGFLNGTAWVIPAFSKKLPPLYFMGSGFLIAGLVASIWLVFEGMPQEITSKYWEALCINTILLAVAFTFDAAAVRVSDPTRVRPIRALTAIFMLGSAWVLTKLGVAQTWETPNAFGIVGIVVVALGLLWIFSEEGIRNALRLALRERGTPMMLIAVGLYSVTSFYDLIAIRESSNIFYLATIFPLVGVLCLIGGKFDKEYLASFLHGSAQEKHKMHRRSYFSCWSLGALVGPALFGVFYAIATMFHMITANVTGHVTYVVAIKDGLTAVDAALTVPLTAGLMMLIGKKVDDDRLAEIKKIPRRLPGMALVGLGVYVVVGLGLAS